MIISTHRKSAFSLIEVMIGLAIFSIVAVGVASASLQASRIAYSNIYRNTAFTAAQGYAEQIKSISYFAITSALENPTLNTIPTKSLSLGAGQTAEIDDPLRFNERSLKKIVIDVEERADGSLNQRVMNMWITPTARDLRSAPEGLKAIEITLNFEWELVMSGFTKTNVDSIKLLKTDVTEY
ncbi:MAG TPA: hypothetical protein DCX06_00420 [Opitutae bacterium]|nr:hypothetical protein [Opitutae bacterium]